MEQKWVQWVSLGGLVVAAAALGGLMTFALSLLHSSGAATGAS